MSTLVTGATGYIGSHTLIALLQAGHEVVGIDNFINSKPDVLRRIELITGTTIQFQKLDLRDKEALNAVFTRHQIDTVIHFAGLKAVGESVEKPIEYYNNNLISTLNLLEAMNRYGCCKMVFSSSATVYGAPKSLPLDEESTLSATNPYGRTKLFIEEILRDYVIASKRSHFAILRYFNPVGAHASGMIGEDPSGRPNNLFPYMAQVAVGRLPELRIFGNDYPTPDGTGVRDFIHVSDLARGHVCAVEHIDRCNGAEPINLGTGRGYSVLEAIQAFEKASGKRIPYKITGRRPGDIAACYANPSKAERLLDWRATLDLDAMCRDHWHWQSQNPNGYD